MSGKLKATFVRFEEYQGDRCAVIEYKGMIRVRSEPEEVLQERMETCDLEQVTYRSLKYGINLKTTLDIATISKGRMKIDEHDAEFVGNGRMWVTYEATVESYRKRLQEAG